ncbi:MAG: hypothetical protein PWP66_52 [Thermosediminibacterales bacterium]|jgi:hypothetical protein|nr:hypothetical protein [Thermosediminibacterales bacterium]MDK2901217.1 hypothetical protein [Thermosediminibacterales bacterium]
MKSTKFAFIGSLLITIFIIIRYLIIGVTIKSLVYRSLIIFLVYFLLFKTFYILGKRVTYNKKREFLDSLDNKINIKKIEPLNLERIKEEQNEGKIIKPKKH